ncbi:MAG: hypothetical protein ACRC8S_11885 [Fimbriiglobus sp.]
MSLKAWMHKLRTFDDRIPLPEPGTLFWKRFFAQARVYTRLARDRDFQTAYTQYLQFTPPLDDSGVAIHNALRDITLKVLSEYR